MEGVYVATCANLPGVSHKGRTAEEAVQGMRFAVEKEMGVASVKMQAIGGFSGTWVLTFRNGRTRFIECVRERW